MNKMFLCLIALSLFVSSAMAEPNHEEAEVTTQKLTDRVYMLQGSGGNIGVSVGEDGVLMIDTQFEPLADKIRTAIQEISQAPIKYVINTHYHHDHTDGNKKFGEDAVIIAHENLRQSLADGRTIELFNKVIPPQPKEALPEITFEDSLSLHFNGEEILVMYFPDSHTDTDSVVFFLDDNVVHMGDLFFNGMYPFIDVPAGGSVEGLIVNLEVILNLIDEDTQIIPGHGPLAVWEDLNDFRDMLIETNDLVRFRMQEGLSLDDIKKAGLPGEITERWGNGFLNTDQWIGILHSSLIKE